LSALLLIASVRTAAAFLVVTLYILIIGPPTLLLARFFRASDLLYRAAHGGIWLGLALAGIRHRVAGSEHLPRAAAVYCANHQSNVDPPVLFRVIHPRLHVLYKAELNKLPLLGPAFGLGGFVAVDRTNREQSVLAIEEGARSLKQGNSFLIFPEGTRSRTGAVLPFKKGGFLMAIKAQAPVVPIAIQGGGAAMSKGSAIIRPATVSIRIGSPIDTTGMTVDDRDTLVDEARRRVEALLGEGPVDAGHTGPL
jgi:1-acyl-sn-glycerol-3-phosphate acyltransferase